MIESALPALILGGIAGLFSLVALRDLIHEAPGIMRWTGWAFQPLLRAGREGYLPSRPENRRLALAAILLAAIVGWLAIGSVAVVPLAVAAPATARRLVGHRRARYRNQLETAIPEAANAIADSLAAGRSLRTALGELAEVFEGAAAAEFTALRVDLELGRSTASAISGLQHRLPSSRIHSFCSALMAGRESGADLAALMRRFGAAAAAQDRDARDARAATAQARFTGVLVSAMPAGGVLFAELVQPGFIGSILRAPVAVALVIAAGGMQLFGFLAIRRLARARP